MESTKTVIRTLVCQRILQEARPVLVTERYDFMLDEMYGAETFFQNMNIRPSTAIKECDPTAYRCGLNDYCDTDETLIYIDGEYYSRDDIQTIKDEICEEVQAVEGDE
jgi:hypothetical protein